MNKNIKLLVSLPLYFLASYGAGSILEDLLVISEKAIFEKLFFAVFVAIFLAIAEQYLSFGKRCDQPK